MFRDELLQEDIARTRVLDEELRQNDRADQVLAEQTAKIRAMTDDFNAKKHSLHQELANALPVCTLCCPGSIHAHLL